MIIRDKNLTSWGNNPVIRSKEYQPYFVEDVSKAIIENSEILATGNGRSYGDCMLNAVSLSTLHLNNILSLSNGVVNCQAGTTLDELLRLMVPKGYFLPVTPGTKFITLGGAIASDIHGKNHHKDGSISNHILSFELINHAGDTVSCSRTNNEDLFWQTFGAMGLTGIIVSAVMQLKDVETSYIRQTVIKLKGLAETFELFASHQDTTYSVAWIDCLSSGKSQGKSVMFLGEHAKLAEINKCLHLAVHKTPKLFVPFNLPSFTLNALTVKTFNAIYYGMAKSEADSIVHYDPFFYPLDSILNWNRIYGKKGFTQYQFVLPPEVSFEGISKALTIINKYGAGSFLAVLKLFGEGNAKAPNSFPEKGYTLALDFPINTKNLQAISELDALVKDCSGKVYKTKDCFSSIPEAIQSGKFQSQQNLRYTGNN